MSEAMTPLPRWQCHKKVWAAKIQMIYFQEDGTARLALDFGRGREDAYEIANPEWMYKHKPEIGGYYVQYEDGYKSYSPAGAFESGYTRL